MPAFGEESLVWESRSKWSEKASRLQAGSWFLELFTRVKNKIKKGFLYKRDSNLSDVAKVSRRRCTLEAWVGHSPGTSGYNLVLLPSSE